MLYIYDVDVYCIGLNLLDTDLSHKDKPHIFPLIKQDVWVSIKKY